MLHSDPAVLSLGEAPCTHRGLYMPITLSSFLPTVVSCQLSLFSISWDHLPNELLAFCKAKAQAVARPRMAAANAGKVGRAQRGRDLPKEPQKVVVVLGWALPLG